MTESEALRKLSTMGYRYWDSVIWMTTTDYEDAETVWQGNLVADSLGSYREDYEALKAHDWPVNSHIMCGSCGEGESDFGGLCAFCQRELAVEDRGESELSIRREK